MDHDPVRRDIDEALQTQTSIICEFAVCSLQHARVPRGVFYHLNYVRKLGFEETPDYGFLRELFAKVLKNNGDIEDGVYDWNLLNGKAHFRPASRMYPGRPPLLRLAHTPTSRCTMLRYYDCARAATAAAMVYDHNYNQQQQATAPSADFRSQLAQHATNYGSHAVDYPPAVATGYDAMQHAGYESCDNQEHIPRVQSPNHTFAGPSNMTPRATSWSTSPPQV
ncbi:uncharacterized protein BXZ73DRAFT_106395 [Epithele typhae]|uniref:uncharacterized protein n=1 Tax=Epithele typhae TaxID=378194 RepID=UPI002008C169|nr:uncharacterized protein BXZ73DRAFT_106395 [Epithele typhae]KAH9914888.1 hypothetical protein BXZ73DRAFT_106395 [Epithele typhae]